MEYRSELKFRVSEYDLNRIKYRFLPLLKCDEHEEEQGYLVRSIYFDDIYNSYMAENEAGTGFRYKYRIRMYNGNPNYIRLEKKIKYCGMTKKITEAINIEECDMLLNGDLCKLHGIRKNIGKQIFDEVYFEMLHKKLMPKCIVEYERFALIEKAGNVRITFDRNIAGSSYVEQFYNKKIDVIPVMRKEYHILEIKYDQMLPKYILQAADIGGLRRQTFSKYYSTRIALG